MDSGVRPEVWPRRLAHPFGDSQCRGHAQHPAFSLLFLLPALQKWLGVGGGLCILLSKICPNLTCMQLCLVPMVSLYVVTVEDICPSASMAAKHPRSQPVSVSSDGGELANGHLTSCPPLIHQAKSTGIT